MNDYGLLSINQVIDYLEGIVEISNGTVKFQMNELANVLKNAPELLLQARDAKQYMMEMQVDGYEQLELNAEHENEWKVPA